MLRLGAPRVKRASDLLIGVLVAALAAVPCILIAIAIKAYDRGPVIYWSRRIGRGGKNFWMPKFRSMRVATPELATDKLQDPGRWITPLGGLLRRLSIDELPQLWSVIRGDMSLVGPRPALHNQGQLIAARRSAGVDVLRPGITGWAQVNGRDNLSDIEKVAFDREYLDCAGLRMDFKILVMTVFRVACREGVAH